MDDALRRGFKALEAIGCLRREPSAPPPSAPPQAKPAEEEAVPTYSFNFESRHSDGYWIRAMAAWRQIAAHEHLPGAMQWAQKHHPDLHRRVTSELPGAWEQLWDAAAPLDDFQAALDAWVGAHEELIGLFPITRGTK